MVSVRKLLPASKSTQLKALTKNTFIISEPDSGGVLIQG